MAMVDPGVLDFVHESLSPAPLRVLEVGAGSGELAAAVAAVSLHHVEPLRDSCRRLAEVVRPGGTLVLDEIDAARFDEREWFELGPPVRGAYLYRWELPPGLRPTEEEDIAAGRLPRVGVRIVGTRRPGPA